MNSTMEKAPAAARRFMRAAATISKVMWEDRQHFIVDRNMQAMATFLLLSLTAMVMFTQLSFVYFVFFCLSVVTITKRIAAGPTYEYKMVKGQIEGRTILITGASNGIGQMTAFKLAQLQPAKIIVGVRGGDKRAESVAAMILKELQLQNETTTTKMVGLDLDLCDLSSVKKFVSRAKEELGDAGLDIMILNAGAFLLPKTKTVDGFDTLMQGNVIGHHLMTEMLMPEILKSKDKRVVVVSSMSHMVPMRPVDWSKQLREVPPADTVQDLVYGSTKLANVHMVREFHKKYEKEGLRISAVHPGFVSTNITSPLDVDPAQKVKSYVFKSMAALFARSAEQGCQSLLYCALDSHAVPGGYHLECRHVPHSRYAADDTLSASYMTEMDKLLERFRN